MGERDAEWQPRASAEAPAVDAASTPPTTSAEHGDTTPEPNELATPTPSGEPPAATSLCPPDAESPAHDWAAIRARMERVVRRAMDTYAEQMLTAIRALEVKYPPATARDDSDPCPKCGDVNWVGWAAGPDMPQRRQCVRCGKVRRHPASPSDEHKRDYARDLPKRPDQAQRERDGYRAAAKRHLYAVVALEQQLDELRTAGRRLAKLVRHVDDSTLGAEECEVCNALAEWQKVAGDD